MWKYVSRRVKETIELSINVRKSFTIQQNINNNSQQQNDRKHNQQHNNNFKVIPRYQDPSRDKEKSDENFKKKYHRLHNNNRCVLNALSWSTALITGFYASQLLCLYRRRQRFGLDINRCYYSKYVLNTTHSLHQNVKYLLTQDAMLSLLPTFSKFQCPFKRIRNSVTQQTIEIRKRTVEDEFINFKHFVEDPGYKKYEEFFETFYKSSSSNSSNHEVYNVNNNISEQSKTNEESSNEQKNLKESTGEKDEENAIDDAIRQLAYIVGEMEFELGIESITSGEYEAAVDHFKLSSNHNHPGGIFNLALCYERGVGVKKNMQAAKELYEIASELGHAKSFYNLGVFYAQGLGGTRKSFDKAKKYFEQAAELGNDDAIQALSLLLSPQQKKIISNKFSDDDFFFAEKQILSNPISAIDNIVRSVATT
ncbi:CLUMA_CG012643, isoform A [Clunio marinus]|uniref:CLUMA_CG012643, isoform A n=1 Tax=Clunio marinus TaxID=568069 RepID=A0A1J1IK60_9DIPT|nr:CLUMA_CG012643, isoform A [Clunio marinus]